MPEGWAPPGLQKAEVSKYRGKGGVFERDILEIPQRADVVIAVGYERDSFV